MLNIAIDEPSALEVIVPEGLEQAVAIVADNPGQAAFLAGGSDLLGQLKSEWRSPRVLVNLKALPGLRGIREEGGAIAIGALTPLAEIERDSKLRAHLPALSLAASRVATPQIRNMGTLGGNLLQESRCPYYRGGWDCYRAGGSDCYAELGIHTEHAIFGAFKCNTVTPSDLGPALVALDAQATVQTARGIEAMPVGDLFLSPRKDIRHMHRLQKGEILTSVTVPLRGKRRSTFIKYAMRKSWDFALASVAVSAVIEDGIARDCRVVYGGVAAIPWRSRPVEAVIEGASLTPERISAAAEAATEDAEPLPDNEYKLALVRKLVFQALNEVSS
jgi:xanthine dehydrogenase YagS FAD-binding subunit